MEETRVRKLLYPLKGISRSWLVEATDNNIYVLKLHGVVGPNLLFNEAFGSELLRHLGLPVPAWTQLACPRDVFEQNPNLETCDRHLFSSVGFAKHFGSRIVVSGTIAGTYQVIPSKWASRVVNAPDFVGALAVDIWTSHCDSRQAIYTHSGSEALRATFIDHGNMFGGPYGNKTCRPFAAMAPDLHLYHGVSVDRLLRQWEAIIKTTTGTTLKRLLKAVPQDWQSPNMADEVLSLLEYRRKDLRSLFQEAASVLNRKRFPYTLPRFVRSVAPRLRQTFAN